MTGSFVSTRKPGARVIRVVGAARLARVGRALCLAGGTLGAVGLLGWLLDEPFLRIIVSGQPEMKPNTAIALMLIGVGGALRCPVRANRVVLGLTSIAAAVVLAIGIGTLAEYAFQIDLAIDQFLLLGGGEPYPGRPSPPTALSLGLLAAALLVFDARRRGRAWPSEWLILAGGLVAFIALLGLAFGAGPLYRLPDAPITGVAVPTAVALLLIATGMLLERPGRRVMALLLSPGPGGLLLRRFVPAILLAPLLLKWVVTWLLAAVGVHETSLIFAVLATLTTVLGLSLLFTTAAALDRTNDVLAASREELRLANERVSLALRGGDLATWDWDIPSGGVVFDARWAEMRGFRPDEIRPHVDSWLSNIHPDDLPRVRKALDDYQQGRVRDYEVEFRARTASADWIWVLGRGRAFGHDEQGRTTRMAGTELDITPRKRAEEKLRLAEATSSGILSISADAIISTDEEQRITMFNDGAERIFGYARGEVIGAPLDILIPESLGAAHHRHVEAFAASEDTARRMGERVASIRGLRNNGEEFPADATISKLEVGGSRILTVSLRDMTLQRKLEEELRRAVQARDSVMGIVAHDLRNPLSAILMEAELLRIGKIDHGRRSGTPAEAIARSARRMNRLIQDLLDVTVLEHGRLSVEHAGLRTQPLLSEALDAQRALAAAASLELELDLAPGAPTVWGDHDRLLQVFENLIGNAAKFTESGGRITVGAAPHGGEVLFWVADTGPGIRHEDLPHLFDPFWQAGEHEAQGAGLGLPIVKGIVEAHGGRIWVESAPKRGSTFFFTIPTPPATDAERSAPAAA